MPENIGFISTRFAGTDGVSLESAKWAEVFERYKHKCFWYAGLVDRSPETSFCIPESFFGLEENVWINDWVWRKSQRDPEVSRRVTDLASYLKHTLYDFVEKYNLSILVIENALSIPMHIPLGLAITEFLIETRIPAIAHHHDFYWERTRFSVNCVSDYLETAFPPRDIDIQHVVINQAAQEELSWRKGVPSMLIPNVLDFEQPPPPMDTYASDVREEIGLTPKDIMILQPTRIVPRKGIEHAIKLVQMLGDRKYKLVISHQSGDEGNEYIEMLSELAEDSNVDLRFISTRIGEYRQLDKYGKKIYTLWDIYPHADLITYPSLYEGFGNAFLEAIYFSKPVLINRYSIFTRDIEPKGFQVPIMDGFLTRSVVEEVRRMLEDEDYRDKAAQKNYRIAKRFYSYSVLQRCLRTLMTNLTGISDV